MDNEFGKPNGIHMHHRVSRWANTVHKQEPYRAVGTCYYTDWNGKRRKQSVHEASGVSNEVNEIDWPDEWETNYFKRKIGKYRSRL